MAATPLISVNGLKKAYQCHVAVNDLSFNVNAGQVLGLIGPNGAGKTTTMRTIAGIIPSTGGQITVAGHDVDVSPLNVKQNTAYVPDDPQLFNDLTVEQHFAFTANVYRVADWRQRMNQLLDQFELSGKKNARAGQLSRGMRQKLAICCAYLYRPSAILLDEPMTGLDPRGIRVLKETIVEQSSLGTATVISSHLLAMVEDICSDVLILQQGEKTFCGDLKTLKDEFVGENDDCSLEDAFFNAVANSSS